MPCRAGTSSTDTKWSAKATYKEILWGGTEFELAYEIKENYKDDQTRGVFYRRRRRPTPRTSRPA